MGFFSLMLKRRKRGLSLVEVLMATTIFSMLSVLFYNVFIMNINAYHRRMLEAELWSEAYHIIGMFRSDIFSADGVQLVLPVDDDRIDEIRLLRGQDVASQYNLWLEGDAVFQRIHGGTTVFYDRDGKHVIASRSFALFEDLPVNVITLSLVLGRNAPGGFLEIQTSYQIFLRDGINVTIL